MNLDFPNVTARCQDDLLILESTEPLHILSSAMIGGGCNIARTIVNAHVDKNLGFSNPAKHLQDRVRAVGIEGDFVGLMTAVFLDTVQVCTKMKDGMMVTAVVTAGIGNATRPGLSYVGPRKTGTINTTLPIDCDMEPSAMVNAVITATETKTDVLKELAIPTHDGQGTATGTSSDAIVIACTGKKSSDSLRWPRDSYRLAYRTYRAESLGENLVMRNRGVWVLLLAVLIDVVLGDPPNRFHPVAWMGSFIAWMKQFRPHGSAAAELGFGTGIVASGGLLVAGLGVRLS